jgi:hypothetical protein
VESFDLLLQDRSDVRRVNGQFCHVYWSLHFAPMGPSACGAPLRSINQIRSLSSARR